jgi:mRNA interferase HigB
MRVISLKRLRAFWRAHPSAEASLRLWFRIAKSAEWKSLQDVRRSFPSADGVDTGSGVLTVFNIKGNSYRLITRIRYDYRLINVRIVLTHAEYNRGDWKK